MKKIILTLMATVAMTTSVMAQEEVQQQQRPERRQMDVTEMAKRRTDEAVKKYELNEEQAQKLLDLNTRFFKNMRPGGGRRMGRPDRQQMGERMKKPMDAEKGPGQAPDTLKAERRHGPQGGFRGGFGGNSEEMKKNMEAYDAELKTILTEDQYNAYKKDEQNRRPRMGQGRGPRPHIDNNNDNKE